ncbi:MAG TPA: Dyp-type peroxidase [Opitutaceae bacterium]|jgi:Dyp-type peroxidase family|nr:Dyp-type peroxidase [Opitutaceae bacterium]
MKKSDFDAGEVQGLLASGYAKHPAAGFVLLRVLDGNAAREWLGRIASRITYCGDRQAESKLNVAFSYAALGKLGCSPEELDGFSREFSEGMVTPHRQRILGDLPGGPNDPETWQWGGPRNPPVDILLMVYEHTPAALQMRLDEIRAGAKGVEIIQEHRSTGLKENREHFGFRDGIAQPTIEGIGKPGLARDRVARGEFILGHPDETGSLELAPAMALNGSYVVLRQIVQDVPGFWESLGKDSPVSERIALAAKIVGRWPDGTPLTLSPEPPDAANPTNDFAFHAKDREGLRCPFGAHIRRANPRDTLLDKPAASMKMINRHRLLRRGRSFGLPAPPSAYPEGLAVKAMEGAVGSADLRGLFFICLNASLARQFEFVQQNWLNLPKFNDFTHDTDPLVGTTPWAGPGQSPEFMIQGCPVSKRVARPQTYVRTIGGAYFFLPGRKTVQRLTGT